MDVCVVTTNPAGHVNVVAANINVVANSSAGPVNVTVTANVVNVVTATNVVNVVTNKSE